MKTHLQQTARLLPSEESLLRKNLGEDYPLPLHDEKGPIKLGFFLEKIRREKTPLSPAMVEFFNEVLQGFEKTVYHV